LYDKEKTSQIGDGKGTASKRSDFHGVSSTNKKIDSRRGNKDKAGDESTYSLGKYYLRVRIGKSRERAIYKPDKEPPKGNERGVTWEKEKHILICLGGEGKGSRLKPKQDSLSKGDGRKGGEGENYC